MGGYSGRALQIKIDDTVIAACRSKSVSLSRTSIDNSHEFGDGWRHVLPVEDQRQTDVSVEGVATINNYELLRNIWLGLLFSDLTVAHANGASLNGDAFLTSLTYAGEYGGFVSFTAAFAFSGSPETVFAGTNVSVAIQAPAGVVASEVAQEQFSIDPITLPTTSDSDPVELPDGSVVVPGGVIALTGDGGTNDGIWFAMNDNGIVDVTSSTTGAVMSGAWGATTFSNVNGHQVVGEWHTDAPQTSPDIGEDYDFRIEVLSLTETVKQSEVQQFRGTVEIDPPDWRQMTGSGGIGSYGRLRGLPAQGSGALESEAILRYEVRRRSDNVVMGRCIIHYTIDIT